MKFFTKLFLCTVLMSDGGVGSAEYFTVSASLNNAVEHQVESGLQQHQLVKYAIQSGVLNASRTGSVDERALTDIAGQAADAMSVNLSLAQSGESALYSNLADGLSAAAGTDGGIGYQILERTVGSGVHSDWLVMTSTFQQSGYALELTTARSMQRSASRRRNCCASAASGSFWGPRWPVRCSSCCSPGCLPGPSSAWSVPVERLPGAITVPGFRCAPGMRSAT